MTVYTIIVIKSQFVRICRWHQDCTPKRAGDTQHAKNAANNMWDVMTLLARYEITQHFQNFDKFVPSLPPEGNKDIFHRGGLPLNKAYFVF